MTLNVHVSSRLVIKLYRSRDEYVLKYLPGTAPEDFVSLAMCWFVKSLSRCGPV